MDIIFISQLLIRQAVNDDEKVIGSYNNNKQTLIHNLSNHNCGKSHDKEYMTY